MSTCPLRGSGVTNLTNLANTPSAPPTGSEVNADCSIIAIALGNTRALTPDLRARRFDHHLWGRYVQNLGHHRPLYRSHRQWVRDHHQNGSNPTNGAPTAYPSAFLGCHYTNCSPGTNLPIQVSQISSATSSIGSNNVNVISYLAPSAISPCFIRLGATG
ncbi:hypothetical protein ACGF5C_26615 [Micromonospora sp. NPDC047620]|uniref:hypothetical protein n=1 Tax=Micromonospora sp. NPDC047620 TaxID=3364251 RepID=UPI00371AB266